jgi:hypothetical protein
MTPPNLLRITPPLISARVRQRGSRGARRYATAIARQAVLVVFVAVLGLFTGGAAHAESTGLTGQGVVPGATNGDYVHISNTPPASASAHGWWTYSKETELKADVTVQLQVNRGGTWVDVGRAGVERVRPGGGSANRSSARVPCVTLESTEWRSVIDVDIVGVIDSPEKLYTASRRLSCGA